jgi:hypothetical protein
VVGEKTSKRAEKAGSSEKERGIGGMSNAECRMSNAEWDCVGAVVLMEYANE